MKNQNHNVTDLKKATIKYFSENPLYYVLLFFLLSGGIYFSVFFLNPQIAVFSIGVSVFIISLIFNQMRVYMMKQFAKNLGYEYFPKGEISSVSGSLFEVGHSKNILHVISGRDDKHPIRFFLYSFTVGSGKNSHNYSYTIFENTFTGNMPHILLKPKLSLLKSNKFVPLDFPNSQSINLEGSFYKHFTLNVEKEFEIEAYQLFSPNFMEKLINTSKEFGFEFYQNKLYIFLPYFINKMSEITEMFNLCDEISDHIDQANRRIGDDVDSLREAINKYSK